MQACPRAASGRRASRALLKLARVHQHGGWGWPVARWASIAQPLGPPHKGQQAGSTAGRQEGVVTIIGRL